MAFLKSRADDRRAPGARVHFVPDDYSDDGEDDNGGSSASGIQRNGTRHRRQTRLSQVFASERDSLSTGPPPFATSTPSADPYRTDRVIPSLYHSSATRFTHVDDDGINDLPEAFVPPLMIPRDLMSEESQSLEGDINNSNFQYNTDDHDHDPQTALDDPSSSEIPIGSGPAFSTARGQSAGSAPAAVGEEMSSNSPLWKTYMSESWKFDRDMIEGWNKSIDVLLVFAGLFSAVLTTFLVQVSASLSPDPMAATNVLLSDIVLLLRNSTSSDLQSQQSFAAPAWAVWVNSLWYASLGLALSSALISMLSKQWLQAYAPSSSGTLRERSHSRQTLYMSLHDWHVGTIIDSMPVVLHMSVLLFFAGLVIYLWFSSAVVAAVTFSIVGCTSLVYCGTILVPLFDRTCPYYTPAFRRIQKTFNGAYSLGRDLQQRLGRSKVPRDKQRFSEEVRRHSIPEMDCRCLVWLFQRSGNPDVHDEAIRGLAGISLLHARRSLDITFLSIALGRISEGWERLTFQATRPLVYPNPEPQAGEVAVGYGPHRRRVSDKSYYWGMNQASNVDPAAAQRGVLIRALLKMLQSSIVKGSILQEGVSLALKLTDFNDYTFTPDSLRLSAAALRFTVVGLSSETSYIKEQDIFQIIRTLRQIGDADVELYTLLLDSIAFCFAGPLVEPRNFADDGRMSSILAFIFNALSFTEDGTRIDPTESASIRDLRFAAAHALFCVLFDITKYEGYDPTMRFHTERASYFLVPSFFHLLDPESGWLGFLSGNKNAVNSIVANIRHWSDPDEYLTIGHGPIVHVNLLDLLHRLWSAMLSIQQILCGLRKGIKRDLSITWKNMLTIYPASEDLLLQDMRPLIQLTKPSRITATERNAIGILERLFRSQEIAKVFRAFNNASGPWMLASLLVSQYNLLIEFPLPVSAEETSFRDGSASDLERVVNLMAMHLRALKSHYGAEEETTHNIERISHEVCCIVFPAFYRASALEYRKGYEESQMLDIYLTTWSALLPILFSILPTHTDWGIVYEHMSFVPLDARVAPHSMLLHFRNTLALHLSGEKRSYDPDSLSRFSPEIAPVPRFEPAVHLYKIPEVFEDGEGFLAS